MDGNILREYNPTIGNITLSEYNPKNFGVIFQFSVKFPVFELFRVKFQKCYFPKVLYSHASSLTLTKFIITILPGDTAAGNLSFYWKFSKHTFDTKKLKIFII